MSKRYLAMLLVIVTVFGQIMGTSTTVTATEVSEHVESETTEAREKDTDKESVAENVDLSETELAETGVVEETETAVIEETASTETAATEVAEAEVSETETETAVSEIEETENTSVENVLKEERTTEESATEESNEEEQQTEVSESLEEEIVIEEETEVVAHRYAAGNDSVTFSDGEEWEAFISSDEDFRRDGYTWLYLGETQTFYVNITNPTGNACSVRWEVGAEDENGEISESSAITYEIAENNESVTITGNECRGMLAIRAIVTDSESGEETIQTKMNFDVRGETLDLYYPFGDGNSQLPHWDMGIQKSFEYYVENPEYPYGSNFWTDILSLSVENAEDDDGNGEVVTVTEYDDGSGWNLHMERYGHAVGKITYQLYNSEQIYEKTFDIWVGSDVYNLNIASAHGADRILPGETIDLSLFFNRECYDEENGHYPGSTEGVTYEWGIRGFKCYVRYCNDYTGCE